MPFSMEEHIAALVDKLLRVRPRGPYFLGGWCNSGLFAYEMAQHLRRKGYDVPLLVLFDTINVRYAATHAPSLLQLFPQRLRHHRRELQSLSFRERLDYVAGLIRSSGRGWEKSAWRLLRRMDAIPNQAASIGTNRHTAREVEVGWNLERHEFSPYTGPIVLFRTTVQAERFPDPKFGWGELAQGGLTVHEVVSGYHDLFNGPAMNIVARSLGEYFADAASR